MEVVANPVMTSPGGIIPPRKKKPETVPSKPKIPSPAPTAKEGNPSTSPAATPEKKPTIAKTQTRAPWKWVTISLIVLNLFGYAISQSLLDIQNHWVSAFGFEENIRQEVARLQKTRQSLQQESNALQASIGQIEYQIQTQDFYHNFDRLQIIKSSQKSWLNYENKNGITEMGLLDFVHYLQAYFNNGHLEHPVLFRNGNTLEIKNFRYGKNKATFTMHCSNLFGNVFLLSSEIVEIVNGLPHFQNGTILNYQRRRERNGSDTMSFTLNVDLQSSQSKDPSDQNVSSINFLKWAKTALPSSP